MAETVGASLKAMAAAALEPRQGGDALGKAGQPTRQPVAMARGHLDRDLAALSGREPRETLTLYGVAI